MFVSLFLMNTKSYGQITISNTESRDKIVAIDPFNVCGIAIDEYGYFLFSNTSNTFDNAFIMYLGVEKDGAIQTLRDLITLVEMVKTQHVTFQSCTNTSYTASMVHNGIQLSTPKHAGDVYLHKSLLNWLIGQLENPKGGPWNSINDAFHAVGDSEIASGVVAGGQVRKWNDTYYYFVPTGGFYLGNSVEDAVETLQEYIEMSSSNEQVWPIIIMNATKSGRVTNRVIVGSKAAVVDPIGGGETTPLYRVYLKKHLNKLEK